MIGNDIIDLQLAAKQSNWKRNNFLDKLFVGIEKQQILDSGNPELKVWDFWSRKESAYKAYNRTTGIGGFFPLRILCEEVASNGTILFGKVTIADHRYYTKTTVTEHCIHTIACETLEMLEKVKPVFDPQTGFEVLKDARNLPYSLDSGSNGIKPISVSHHGQFYCKIILE